MTRTVRNTSFFCRWMRVVVVAIGVLICGRASLVASTTAVGADPVRQRQLSILTRSVESLKRANMPNNPKSLAMSAYACFVLANQDHDDVNPAMIVRANEHIVAVQEEYPDDTQSYWIRPLLAQIAADPALNRFLNDRAKRALKEQLFHAADETFDLTDAGTDPYSVWHTEGSDNHNVMRKGTCLLTAQFLMNEPQWRDLKYDDGTTPKQNYDAWTAHWLEYLRQRAREGITIEIASPTYAGVFLYPIMAIRDSAADPALRHQADQFLDLYFADAAVESLNGVRGGSKTRAYKDKQVYDHTVDKGHFYSYVLVGLPDSERFSTPPFEVYPALYTNYRLPTQVSSLFQDDRTRGTYEYVSVRPGRGTHSLILEPLWYEVYLPSYLRRTTYVTPDYTLGYFTIDEGKHYTLISEQCQWMGLTTAATKNSRIVFYVTPSHPMHKETIGYRELQGHGSKHAFLVRKQLCSTDEEELWVYVSSDFDFEGDGENWIFGRNGNRKVYFALRGTHAQGNPSYVVEDNKEWGGKWVKFKQPSTVAVLEVARAGEYESFEAFQADIGDNEPEWLNNHDDLHYQPSRDAGHLVLCADMRHPRIDGELVELNPAKAYDCPYIQGIHGEDKVVIRGLDGREKVLDFSY